MPANFQSGANSKVVVKCNSADEATIKGLNALTLPLGFTRTILTVDEFGVDISTKITAGASYDDLSFAGNLVVGDTKGQDVIREYARNNTQITDMRFYLDDDNFVTNDLANDPGSYYQVAQFSPGQATKSGIYPLAVTMTVGGQSALFNAHMTGATMAFVADGTITDSDSGFVDAGFAVGQTLIIEGATTAANDKQCLITAVAAGTITTNTTFTAEAAVAATKIHGGK